MEGEGQLLRRFRSDQTGANQDYAPLSSFPPFLIRAVIRGEDGHFYYHPGVDIAAILRALWQNVSNGKILSGGSTITQQLVRIGLADRLPSNNWFRKLYEIWMSVRITLWHGKNSVLEAYLNRVPMPGNTDGLPAASRKIFGKDMSLLTPEESVAMAIFIRGGGSSRSLFLKRYAVLASRLGLNDEVPPTLLNTAENRHKPASWKMSDYARQARAPHFVDWFRQEFPELTGDIRTTISAGYNDKTEKILQSELDMIRDRGVPQGAVVALKLVRGNRPHLELRVFVGSREYLGEDGQVNGVNSIRSAGSTLKPFVYAMAMERLGYRPWTIIMDEQSIMETGDGGEVYRPSNYDLNYWGRMTVREALSTSRNIPPVMLTQKLGADKLYVFLKEVGLTHMDYGPEHYGMGLALGTTGVSPLRLAMAYGVLASGGNVLPLRVGKDSSGRILQIGREKRVMSRNVAYWITDILGDDNTRRRAFGERSFLDFPFAVAAKTGTSKDYRDAWTVGYTDHHIVAVWVGDFQGDSMNHMSGAYGAGRIFQQVIRLLEEGETPSRLLPPPSFRDISLCRRTGLLAGPTCPAVHEYLPPDEKMPAPCHEDHSVDQSFPSHENVNSGEIRLPRDGQVFYLDPHSPGEVQAIPIEIKGCDGCVYRIDDGQPVAVHGEMRKTIPARMGNHKLELRSSGNVIHRIQFRVVR